VIQRLNRWRESRWDRQRAAPPRPPRGWTIAPPDFVGVAAERSGTSWWYRAIASHPGVSRRRGPKELRYFNRFVDEAFEPRHAEAYARWFPRPRGRITGEWTPSYMSLPQAAAQLGVAASDAKLIAMLRDPVDRLRSALTVRVSRWGPRASDPPPWMVARGLYASQIDRLLEHFSPDALLVLQFERCIADPRTALARTYRFLGLDEQHRPSILRHRVNVTRGKKFDLAPELEGTLLERYEPEVARLTTLVPEFDVKLWPHFRHLG
jgi:Sulfotransferase domain